MPGEIAVVGIIVALAAGFFGGWGLRQQRAYLTGLRDGIACAQRGECWIADGEGER